MKINNVLLISFVAIISFSSSLWANRWTEACKTGDINALNLHLFLDGPEEVFKNIVQLRETAIANNQDRVLVWLEEIVSGVPRAEETTWEELGIDPVGNPEPIPFHLISPIPQDAYALNSSDFMDEDNEFDWLASEDLSVTDSSF